MIDGDRPDQGMLDRVGAWGRRSDRRQARLHWLKYGIREDATPGFTDLYEPPGEHVGVCCSGGGIRSAAFNLGALQVLQSERVLQQAKYLSAVSGGSYIAAAFCMVAKRWTGGPNGEDSDPSLVDDEALPFHPGSPEEQYLRNHLGYLAPDGVAKLYLGLRMVAGLLVNVLLVGLPVLMVGLLAGLWVGAGYGDVAEGSVAIPDIVVVPIVVVFALALALSVLDVVWRPHRDDLQTLTQTWQVRLFLLGAALALLLVAVPWLAAKVIGFEGVSVSDAALGSAGTALSSMAALAAAAVTHVRGRVRDEKQAVAEVTTRLGKYAKRVRELLVALVVILAGPLLLAAVCVLGVLISVLSASEGLAWLLGAGALLGLMWVYVDLTTVSLHPFYRRRLATAFALRRVWLDEDGEEQPAPPPAERGGARGVARERPFDRIVELSKSRVEPGPSFDEWPMLIVCAAANVSDPGATPPGRAVASFTFSPTAIGGPLTGAAATDRYENLGRNRRRDITLPAAVAMSGAALSPSMGKMTFRPLTFLLALANIRLGVWVANPRHVNDACTPTDSGTTLAPGGKERVSLWHRPRPQYLWKELIGRNRLDDKFLYVTDGGHYENLGLVELLRRGCGTIYCFDAGGGSSQGALGDAISLARTELNVEIEMTSSTEELIAADASGLSKRMFATGVIRYPSAPGQDAFEGKLFYVRSVVSEDAPWDLRNYRSEDGVFPNHSTLDQFFDDQRFEAYRRLGMCAARAALSPAVCWPA
jgi:hypothetical protein